MDNNDNKLDILTKKIYQEGIEKAENDAREILQKANDEAQNIIKNAQNQAKSLVENAQAEAVNLKQKTEAEMSMSVKQATASLKQQIVGLISEKISQNITATAFNDKAFINELMATIIKKWNPENGAPDLTVVLSEKEKSQFDQFLAAKHQELLNAGLTIKADAAQKEGFVIQPKDGSYRITFSEAMFNEFFEGYLRNYSKKLLFN
ncbi:MAG: V-type ATP synthase subunit E family protein [Bacteroidales bacterium]|nr:V-type ATP synthase subunit E family protein [Bacteroidales bacterium]